MIDNTRGCITEHCTYRVCITGHPSKVTNLHGTPGLSAFRLSDTHHWYHTYTLHDAWASLPIVNRGSPRFSHALPAPQHASPSVSQRACALASRTVARFSDDLPLDPRLLIALRQHLRLRVEEFDRALESDRRPEASTTVAASRRRCQPGQGLVQLHLEDGHRYLDILLLRT